MNEIKRYDGEFTVILLDDEPGVRDAVQKDLLDLRPHYWSVIATGDSEDCLEVVKSLERPPEAVVIDQVLLSGDRKGHDVIRILHEHKAKGAAVPFLIMLSGKVTPPELLSQNVAMGQVFMHKSDYSGQRLVETIDSYFRENVPGGAFQAAIGRWFHHIVRNRGRHVDDTAIHCVNAVEQEVRKRVRSNQVAIDDVDECGIQLVSACLDEFGRP